MSVVSSKQHLPISIVVCHCWLCPNINSGLILEDVLKTQGKEHSTMIVVVAGAVDNSDVIVIFERLLNHCSHCQHPSPQHLRPATIYIKPITSSEGDVHLGGTMEEVSQLDN